MRSESNVAHKIGNKKRARRWCVRTARTAFTGSIFHAVLDHTGYSGAAVWRGNMCWERGAGYGAGGRLEWCRVKKKKQQRTKAADNQLHTRNSRNPAECRKRCKSKKAKTIAHTKGKTTFYKWQITDRVETARSHRRSGNIFAFIISPLLLMYFYLVLVFCAFVSLLFRFVM